MTDVHEVASRSPFVNPVISIASPVERAWQRYRVARLRYFADRTPETLAVCVELFAEFDRLI